MDHNKNKFQHLETGRRRGWIVNFLYTARPTPLSFNMLWELLDARNMPLTCRQFSEKLEYLRSKGFIRVFKHGDSRELTRPEQAQMIQAFCDMDGVNGDIYFACLSTEGVDFQESEDDVKGVARVN